MTPRLTVVIPTRGRPTVLARALDRLERQGGLRTAFEVVVSSDGADPDPDAARSAIGQRAVPVRHLTGGRPGASAARNRGWRNTRAPLVLFLDDDVLASPRLVAQHLEWHRRHPGREVAVLGRVRWARGLRVTPFMRWLERGVQFDFGAIEGENAGWGRFYTANVSLKRELLDAVGGFDEERFPFHYEDLDLAKRMHDQLGFRLLYNRAAVAEHLHPVTLEGYRRRMAEVAPAELRFLRTHPDVRPHFHDRFRAAVAAPPARGRGRRLATMVPPALPWLGPRVWASANAWFEQQLAPVFLEGWEQAAQAEGAGLASSGGSMPGGPK